MMTHQRNGTQSGESDNSGEAGRTRSVPDFPDLPEATVARLPEYLRALHHLAEAGHETVSSEALAAAAGVNSAKLRKDLSHLGSYGTRGVGYDTKLLVGQIESVLGLTQHRAVALVGVGNLGHALAGYGGFATRGFHFAALIDADPAQVGKRISGLVVRHIDDLDAVVAELRINIAVIATPVSAAQPVADRLVAAGVTSILNFAPCVLTVPDNVDVRKVDLAIELQILSFHENRKAAGQPVAQPPRAAATAQPSRAATAEPTSPMGSVNGARVNPTALSGAVLLNGAAIGNGAIGNGAVAGKAGRRRPTGSGAS
jgi:redox-sensing transcriptional repressor